MKIQHVCGKVVIILGELTEGSGSSTRMFLDGVTEAWVGRCDGERNAHIETDISHHASLKVCGGVSFEKDVRDILGCDMEADSIGRALRSRAIFELNALNPAELMEVMLQISLTSHSRGIDAGKLELRSNLIDLLGLNYSHL